MANLAVLSPSLSATTVTYAAASAGGDELPAVAGGAQYDVYVKNGSGSTITVTLDDPTSVTPASATTFNPDVQFTVVAGAEGVVRINADRFRDPSDGNISITYSSATSVTVLVVRAK